MNYFNPRLYLGMTATPDRRDDKQAGRSIYELFNYEIACEIRLNDALENDLLCPFHYFGISDIVGIDDDDISFSNLTSDERVKHVMEKADLYGCSGERVKGLIFCGKIDEARELSVKFNERGWRTLVLTGSNTQEERQNAIDRLTKTDGNDCLDYILSVDIFSDGWEFPGGKIEQDETPENAIVREIHEELDTEIRADNYLTTIEYDYPTFHLSMKCYICSVISGSLKLLEHENAKWLSRDELFSVQWLPADVKVVEALMERGDILRAGKNVEL